MDMVRLFLNKRFRTIFSLFVSFMFQFWWLGKIKRFLSKEETDKRYKALYEKQAKRFTETALDLGGLLIKLGQFFSSRVDILPKEYTDELSKLQDSVRSVETSIIRDRIEKELGQPLQSLFQSFSDQSLAAASLGQVHQARLLTGEDVAVKILRPGIEQIIEIDFEAMKLMVAFAKRYPKISNSVDLDLVYQEFRKTVSDELDYRKEATNAKRFKGIFANDPTVYIPHIYTKLSSEKVLTMEFINGYKINNVQAMNRENINKAALAQTLLKNYLHQVLHEGFFHADPHPGNILVKSDGTLVLLDFGMVGHVDQNMKENMVKLALGIFKKDPGAVVEAFDQLGFLRPHADRGTIFKSVRLMLSNLFGETMDFGNLDVDELSLELRELVYSQPFQMPAETTFLGKAIITVFGLCSGLDKDFNFIESVRPYFEEMISENKSSIKGGVLLDQAKKVLFDLVALPEKMNRFINGIESGEIRLQPSRGFEQRLLENQTFLAQRIVSAIVAIGFILAGTQLLNTFYETGVFLMVIGGLASLSLFRKQGSSQIPRRGMRNMGSGFKKPRLHP